MTPEEAAARYESLPDDDKHAVADLVGRGFAPQQALAGVMKRRGDQRQDRARMGADAETITGPTRGDSEPSMLPDASIPDVVPVVGGFNARRLQPDLGSQVPLKDQALSAAQGYAGALSGGVVEDARDVLGNNLTIEDMSRERTPTEMLGNVARPLGFIAGSTLGIPQTLAATRSVRDRLNDKLGGGLPEIPDPFSSGIRTPEQEMREESPATFGAGELTGQLANAAFMAPDLPAMASGIKNGVAATPGRLRAKLHGAIPDAASIPTSKADVVKGLVDRLKSSLAPPDPTAPTYEPGSRARPSPSWQSAQGYAADPVAQGFEAGTRTGKTVDRLRSALEEPLNVPDTAMSYEGVEAPGESQSVPSEYEQPGGTYPTEQGEPQQSMPQEYAEPPAEEVAEADAVETQPEPAPPPLTGEGGQVLDQRFSVGGGRERDALAAIIDPAERQRVFDAMARLHGQAQAEPLAREFNLTMPKDAPAFSTQPAHVRAASMEGAHTPRQFTTGAPFTEKNPAMQAANARQLGVDANGNLGIGARPIASAQEAFDLMKGAQGNPAMQMMIEDALRHQGVPQLTILQLRQAVGLP